IQIPNTLSYSGGFGIEGAVLQLFGTWLRNSEKQLIHTAVQDVKPDSFEDLCNSLFGLCALRLSDEILSSNMTKVDLVSALAPAKDIFKNIRSENFKSAFKGPYLAIPAIRALVVKGGKDREFDSPLYNMDEVIGAGKFKKLTSMALTAVEPRAGR